MPEFEPANLYQPPARSSNIGSSGPAHKSGALNHLLPPPPPTLNHRQELRYIQHIKKIATDEKVLVYSAYNARDRIKL